MWRSTYLVRPLDLSRPTPPDLALMTNAVLPVEPQASVVNVPETKAKKKTALNEGLVQYSLPVTEADRDVEAFLRSQKSNIRGAVEDAVQRDM